MQDFLPDFGDLILSIALLFGALIVVLLDEIAREFADCQRTGWF
jgi:hypothetical protein